jgi:hypothetical protein
VRNDAQEMTIRVPRKSVVAGSRIEGQGDSNMIQAIHRGVEIELMIHQMPHGAWRCDYTLITHPERTQTIHYGKQEFTTMDLANEHALQEARDRIDRDSEGQPERNVVNPPRQVHI